MAVRPQAAPLVGPLCTSEEQNTILSFNRAEQFEYFEAHSLSQSSSGRIREILYYFFFIFLHNMTLVGLQKKYKLIDEAISLTQRPCRHGVVKAS